MSIPDPCRCRPQWEQGWKADEVYRDRVQAHLNDAKRLLEFLPKEVAWAEAELVRLREKKP